MIKPIGKNILIEVEEIKEINGIALPDEANQINERAKVLEVGNLVDPVIKKGEIIYFKSWALDTVEIQSEKKKISFIHLDNILGIENGKS